MKCLSKPIPSILLWATASSPWAVAGDPVPWDAQARIQIENHSPGPLVLMLNELVAEQAETRVYDAQSNLIKTLRCAARAAEGEGESAGETAGEDTLVVDSRQTVFLSLQGNPDHGTAVSFYLAQPGQNGETYTATWTYRLVWHDAQWVALLAESPVAAPVKSVQAGRVAAWKAGPQCLRLGVIGAPDMPAGPGAGAGAVESKESMPRPKQPVPDVSGSPARGGQEPRAVPAGLAPRPARAALGAGVTLTTHLGEPVLARPLSEPLAKPTPTATTYRGDRAVRIRHMPRELSLAPPFRRLLGRFQAGDALKASMWVKSSLHSQAVMALFQPPRHFLAYEAPEGRHDWRMGVLHAVMPGDGEVFLGLGGNPSVFDLSWMDTSFNGPMPADRCFSIYDDVRVTRIRKGETALVLEDRFDQGIQAWQDPEGVAEVIAASTPAFCNGRPSLCIQDLPAGEGAKAPHVFHDLEPLQAGETVTVTAWARAAKGKTIEMGLRPRESKDGEARPALASASHPATGDWQWVALTATPGREAAEQDFRLHLAGNLTKGNPEATLWSDLQVKSTKRGYLLLNSFLDSPGCWEGDLEHCQVLEPASPGREAPGASRSETKAGPASVHTLASS